jgi:hypothetical protein
MDDHLVAENHLQALSFTVAFWMNEVENAEKKGITSEKNLVSFCRLFLEQEKKRGYIKDFNEQDVWALKVLALATPISAIEKFGKANGWDYQKIKAFEKAIGYTK